MLVLIYAQKKHREIYSRLAREEPFVKCNGSLTSVVLKQRKGCVARAEGTKLLRAYATYAYSDLHQV